MHISTITKGSQITLPVGIQRHLDVGPTDKVALEIYATHPKFDFEDAVVVAHMEDRDIAQLYSYGMDFDEIKAIKRRES